MNAIITALQYALWALMIIAIGALALAIAGVVDSVTMTVLLFCLSPVGAVIGLLMLGIADEQERRARYARRRL